MKMWLCPYISEYIFSSNCGIIETLIGIYEGGLLDEDEVAC